MSGHLMENALIYMGAAVLCVPIAKRLGLGSVLGYLLAGIIIGPYLLGFVGEEGEDIMHFAEFGVVIMLFLIGLELDPKAFWQMRKQVVGLGSWQMGLSILLFFGIAHWGMAFKWQEALALGMALSMSSTALVLQNMKEQGRMNSAAGKSAFAVLLFQDIMVIPILAFLPLIAPQLPLSSQETGWMAELSAGWKALVVLGSIASVIVIGRYLMEPVFKWVAATRVRELFVATALLLVVGVAVLMQSVGLSAALGSFLAGVVLANSAFRHELESDLEPFKGLLLGLFFMAVGASINFALIGSRWFEVLLLVIGIMSIKAFVLAITGRRFGFGTDQNLIFSLGLLQVGEFAFVLFAFMSQLSLLEAETLQLFMAITALSMTLTPVIGLLNERFLLPQFGTKQSQGTPDVAASSHEVIIAGFGHYGSTVGRFLRAAGISCTILDFDADQVDLLRKMGFKVFYGDATRHDLLELAGAAEAKILISAIPNTESNLILTDLAKKHFPHLQFFARSRNRFEAYELMEAGLTHIYRETLDTSVRMGVDVLSALGRRKHSAYRLGQDFIKYDQAMLTSLALKKENMTEYILSVRKTIAWQESLLREDQARSLSDDDHHWDSDAIKQNLQIR